MNPENEPIPDAPIVEAVVDIDCELAPGMDITSLRDAAGDALRERYPKFRKQLIQEHQFSQKADAPPELKMRQGVGAMQFLSDDERQLVQFRPNGFSFNRLTPYRSLDDYFPEIEAGWNLYLKLAKPVRVRKLGMRMINRILLPMVDGQVQLSEFLTVYPKLPETGSTLNFAGFLDQHKAIDVKSGNQVTIIKTIEVTQGNKLPLILDIEAFYPCKEYPQDWEVLRERLNSLRSLKNQIFRNSITQQCQNHFSQQA